MRLTVRENHITWDKTNERWVGNWRFPKRLHHLTGEKFKFRCPKEITRTQEVQAKRVEAQKLAEYNAIVAAAEQRGEINHAWLTEDMAKFNAATRRIDQGVAGIRAAAPGILARLDAIDVVPLNQRIEDERIMHIAAARLGRSIIDVTPAKPRCDLEDVLTAWKLERKQLNHPLRNDDPIKERRAKMHRLFTYAGTDNLAEIDKPTLQAYRLKLIQEDDANGTQKTRHHLIEIKATFALAKTMGVKAGGIAEDPAVDLTYPGKNPKNKRPPLTEGEAAAILPAAMASADPVVKWATLLAAYTTAGNDEILSAQASEFYIDPRSQRWVWDMRDRMLKCPGVRERCLPLHREITESGFLDYLATRKGNGLFDVSTDAGTDRLNDFMKPIELDGVPIGRTFYSWRKRNVFRFDSLTRKAAGGNEAKEKMAPSLSRYIAGHAAKDLHESFYNFHEFPDEFPDVIAAIDLLPVLMKLAA